MGWRTMGHGMLAGCDSYQWTSNWEAVIGIYLVCIFTGVFIACYMATSGQYLLGLFGYLVFFGFGVSWFAPHCGIGAEHWGNAAIHISIWIMVALTFVCGIILIMERERGLKPTGWLSKIIFTRVGAQQKGFMQKDLVLIGPLNDFLGNSIAEISISLVVVAWLVLSGVAYYSIFMDDDTGPERLNPDGNSVRAVGRALAQIAMRLIFLSLVSAQRNTVLYQCFGIPYDRSVKWHKIIGRLQICVMYAHVLCMVIGGPTANVEWNSKFNMYRGYNLWPGPIALFFWTSLLLGGLPIFRRFFFDTFYFLHIQFFFMGNIFTILHNRAGVVWVAAGIGMFYIDIGLRLITKLTKVEVKSLEIVSGKIESSKTKLELASLGAAPITPSLNDEFDDENPIVKMVVVQNGYPKLWYKHEVGSWIFLSVGGKDKEGNDLMAPSKVPGGPPTGLPAALMFHPMTITRFNEDTREITMFIKSFGSKEFSGQLAMLAEKVSNGSVELNEIKAHVGGPHGALMVPYADMDGGVVLVSGGIGITAMAVILEDILKSKRSGAYNGKVFFLWATRSAEECEAFSYLWDLCKGVSDVTIHVHYTKGEYADSFRIPTGEVFKGRFDLQKSFATVFPDGIDGKKWATYACGPELMMIDAEQFVAKLNRGGSCQMYYHHETFEW